MRTRLWLTSILLTLSTPLIGAETASQALAKLPPLPKAASAGMDCSLAEATDKKIQAQLAPMMASPAYGGAAVQMTPAQMQAFQAMSDPAFNECFTELQTNPSGLWVAELKDKLDAKLQQIHTEWATYCQRVPSEACMGDPAGYKRYNEKAAAAGTQFLSDAQPQYDKQLKQVGACVALREKGMAGAAGLKGPMETIVTSTNGATWGLVGLPAATHSELCSAAREAARQFLPSPP